MSVRHQWAARLNIYDLKLSNISVNYYFITHINNWIVFYFILLVIEDDWNTIELDMVILDRI